MKTKILVGISLMVIFGISILTSIPNGIDAVNDHGIAFAIGRMIGGNLFSIFGIIAGVILYKIGKADLELSKNTAGESFSDITK